LTLAEGDDVIIETDLQFNGLEFLPVGGMPTGSDQVYSDESVLFRVSVANFGLADAGNVHINLLVDGSHQHTFVIPHIAPSPGEGTAEWASEKPYAVGQHHVRVEFDPKHDPEHKHSLEYPLTVLKKAASDHAYYGQLLQTAVSRCNEHVTKDFLTVVEQRCQHFATAAKASLKDLNGESNESVQPLFAALAGIVKKTIELALPEVKALEVAAAGVMEFATAAGEHIVSAAASSQAEAEHQAKARLEKLADEMAGHAKDGFMAGWAKWDDAKLQKALELAIAAEDEVPPDPAKGGEFSRYIDALMWKIGLPRAENFDTGPLYDEFRRTHWHVLQHLHGSDYPEPSM
jgi:hypothetical protein